MKTMKAIAILALAAALAGCAAPGSVLTGERLEAMRQGMTRDETLRLLGSPDERMRFPATRTEAWDYHYTDPWGYIALYSVTFGPDGRIVSLLTTRLNDGGDHGTN